MLKLTNIYKDYPLTKDNVVHALKGISIQFPEAGLISILGHSGCGKTTLLNIIGGLDKYTLGDLEVDGVSTINFKDSDWDNYRNKKIGMVFQSYNLIAHMSVLSNVELALSLSGVDRQTRKSVATEALKEVGLEKEIDKFPNQMSGGQMQRVAIARALVNNPSVILADEPTGALDSKTSVQIMEILERISKTKLVIMVTHNRSLAEEYSTRIIEMNDGEIISNNEHTPSHSSPSVTQEVEKKEEVPQADYTYVSSDLGVNIAKELKKAKHQKKEKSSMSLLTASSISVKNMKTKKGRSIMTSIAGSFGIIGVALILALSTGFTNFINNMQEETLASYPISVEEMWVDTSAMMNNTTLEEFPKDSNVNVLHSNLNMHTNNINDEYITYVEGMNKNYYSSIQNNYALRTNILSQNYDNSISVLKTDQQSLLSSLTTSTYWYELPTNDEFVLSKYDVIEGHYPQNANECVLVVNKANAIGETSMKALGFDSTSDKVSFTDILNKTYKMVANNDYYTKQTSTAKSLSGRFVKSVDKLKEEGLNFTKLLEEITNFLTSMSTATIEDYSTLMTNWDKIIDKYFESETDNRDIYSFTAPSSQDELLSTYNKGKDLKIVGILRPNEASLVSLLNQGVYYPHSLVEESIKTNSSSPIALDTANHMVVTPTSLLGMNMKLPHVYSSSGTEPTELTDYTSSNPLSGLYNATQQYVTNRKLVGTDLSISSLTIYPKTFDDKAKILSYLDAFNTNKAETDQVKYTDLAGTIFSSLGTMINVISSVLIAFSSISLIVSSVMIGIITYSSVIERTKEIGILRSIGARKKDISRLFKTEAVILGFLSGAFGVLITFIACFPINAILSSLYKGVDLSHIATVDPLQALVLILISMLLTYISALIPSRFAAKKDPVKALRTE